jgi:hypothetical protein
MEEVRKLYKFDFETYKMMRDFIVQNNVDCDLKITGGVELAISEVFESES